MQNKQKEILLICQEECAEVTQAISKTFRFGFDAEYNGRTNKQRLEEELGDLVCMIGLMIDSKLVDENTVEQAAIAKMNKLKQWSGIFKDE
jgi:NTP pyrophosphatase (non-canonical NTP hydrolase)